MRIMCVLVMLLALGVSATAFALQRDKAFHHYVRSSWSIEEGLPQISALAIEQDRAGYVWVGTQGGLARFDGVRFVTYTPQDEPALPGAWVRALHADRDSHLWIGTYKGVAVHDGTGFVAVPASDAQRWPTLDVFGFAESAAGVWAATNAGVFRAQDGRLHAVPGSPAPAQALLARDDGLWVGTRGAVFRHSAGNWQALPLPATAKGAPVNRLVEAQGRIWAGTALGLFVLDGSTWRAFDAPQLVQAPVELLYADGDGNLWAGGDSGLARIRDGKLVEFVDAARSGGISALRTAFEDREGNLWLGSQLDGLTRLWNGWTRRYSLAEGLGDPIVWSLAADPDGRRIWVGGNDGVSLLDQGRITRVVPASTLPHPQGYNLLAEVERLWIGTRLGLVVVEHAGEQAGVVQRPAVLAPLANARSTASCATKATTSGSPAARACSGCAAVSTTRQSCVAMPEPTDCRIRGCGISIGPLTGRYG